MPALLTAESTFQALEAHCQDHKLSLMSKGSACTAVCLSQLAELQLRSLGKVWEGSCSFNTYHLPTGHSQGFPQGHILVSSKFSILDADCSCVKTGSGLMLVASLATAASLMYILLSGGNPITSPQPSAPSPPSNSQPPSAGPSSKPDPKQRDANRHHEDSRGRGLRLPFFGGRGKARGEQPDDFPADKTDEALLEASSAAVSESFGSNLSPTEVCSDRARYGHVHVEGGGRSASFLFIIWLSLLQWLSVA